jgi:hypothetical protein
MPKSGTWYSSVFFWVLFTSIAKRKPIKLKNLEKTIDKKKLKLKCKRISCCDKFYIGHTNCPGFEDYFKSIDPEFYTKWSLLKYPTPYNWLQKYLERDGNWNKLNPAITKDSRIVYLCRNPFDHFVSFFNHVQNHKDESHRFFTDKNGKKTKIETIEQFIFDFGALNGFIKHYLTFKKMQESFPENVKIIYYSELMESPRASFQEIIDFLDLGLTPRYKKYFEHALELSGKDSLSEIESRINRSLADDQLEDSKHIRSGNVGEWKKYLSNETVKVVVEKMKEYGINIVEFPALAHEKLSASYISLIFSCLSI